MATPLDLAELLATRTVARNKCEFPFGVAEDEDGCWRGGGTSCLGNISRYDQKM